MKIFLTVDEPKIDGYFWASPANEKIEFAQEFYKCEQYCMEGQCTELYGPQILDIFLTSELEQYIPYWAKFIPSGGRMILGGMDIYILSKMAIRRSMDLGVLNEKIFKKPYAIQSITSAESTKDFMKSVGFKIANISIDEGSFNYVVEGIKN